MPKGGSSGSPFFLLRGVSAFERAPNISYGKWQDQLSHPLTAYGISGAEEWEEMLMSGQLRRGVYHSLPTTAVTTLLPTRTLNGCPSWV